MVWVRFSVPYVTDSGKSKKIGGKGESVVSHSERECALTVAVFEVSETAICSIVLTMELSASLRLHIRQCTVRVSADYTHGVLIVELRTR